MSYEETIRFDEEINRLQDRKSDLADRAAGVDEDSDEFKRLSSLGTKLDKRIRAVQWARDEAHTDSALPTRDGEGRPCPVWDDDVDAITFQSIEAELALIEDEINSKADALDLRSTTGMARARTIAYGTVDAPYHDPGADIAKQVKAVQKLPPEFKKWAEAAILDMSTLGNGNEKSFAAAVFERRAREESLEETSEQETETETTSTPSA